MPNRVFYGFHRSVAPQRNRYFCLFSQPLGRDLVAQSTHRVTVRADEHNAHLQAQVREIRMLSYKAPSHPCRVGARSLHRCFQASVVDVGALGLIRGCVDATGRAQPDCFVRLANEHGMTVRLCVKRDGTNRSPVFAVELAHRMDETHRGFTAIDDSYPLKFALHNPSNRAKPRCLHSIRQTVTVCRACKDSALTPSGRATVR